jgi:hypothetical protein
MAEEKQSEINNDRNKAEMIFKINHHETKQGNIKKWKLSSCEEINNTGCGPGFVYKKTDQEGDTYFRI